MFVFLALVPIAFCPAEDLVQLLSAVISDFCLLETNDLTTSCQLIMCSTEAPGVPCLERLNSGDGRQSSSRWIRKLGANCLSGLREP